MKKLMFLLSIVVLFSTTSCLIGDSSLGDSSAEIKGTLTVFNEDNSISYEAHNASITVAITNFLVEPKLDILFNGVKFAEAMPVQVNIKFGGIPFTFTASEDGKSSNYIFDTTNIIPTISGAPRDEYMASRFYGCVGRYNTEIRFTIPYKDNKMVQFTANTNENKE